MYRKPLRAIAAISLLFAFWSALRLGGLTLFDWSLPVVVIAALPFSNSDQKISFSRFRWPIIGLVLFIIAGIFSLINSSDTADHLQKVTILFSTLCMMLIFAYQLARKNILSLVEVLSILVVSGTIGSFVCLLQGHFGILTNINPGTLYDDPTLNRFTGLAQHPIETGTVSAFACVIALGLAIHTRRWLPYFFCALINLYAMKYSASLTAIFAVICSICAFCVFSRSYAILAFLLAVCIIGTGIALSSGTLGPLAHRLTVLEHDQGNYLTLQYREQQWAKTIGLIDGGTVALGNGYSQGDLPDGMDIHNGLLAAIFHFGVLGLCSQLCFIWFFTSRLFGDAPRTLRAILLGSIIIFASAYLTGPPFSRRTLWIPVFMMAAYLPERTSKKHSAEFLSFKN